MKVPHALVVVLLLASVVRGQQPTPATTPNPEQLPNAVLSLNSPELAVIAADQDLMSLPPESRPFQWYVWFDDGNIEKAQRCNFIVNNVVVEMSCADIAQPVIINDGYLLRYDTRDLGPTNIARMHRLLDRIIDPRFYLVKDEVIRSRIPTTPYKASNGQTYDFVIEERVITAFGNTVAGAYEQALRLQAESRRMVPIVSYEYFLTKTQSQINGGMYYDFIGVKDIKPEKGQSQLEAYLKKYAGVTLNEVLKEYLDQRSVTVISNITRKERMVLLFSGYKTAPGRNTATWSITLDVAEQAFDGDQSPLRNLGSIARPLFRFAGGEIIGERMNGGNVYLLVNALLNFVDEVPPNIASDRLIPSRHGTSRLEPAISCYRCHVMKESPDEPEPMGWKSLVLDARAMLKGQAVVVGGVPMAVSLSPVSDPVEIKILNGRYNTEFAKPLRRTREDLSDFVVACTQNADQATTQVFQGIADDFGAYHYDYVNSETVCRELGLPVPVGGEPALILQAAILRRTSQLPTQDPFIVRLIAGGDIRRETWESILQDTAKLITPEDVLNEMSRLQQGDSGAELPVNTDSRKEKS